MNVNLVHLHIILNWVNDAKTLINNFLMIYKTQSKNKNITPI